MSKHQPMRRDGIRLAVGVLVIAAFLGHGLRPDLPAADPPIYKHTAKQRLKALKRSARKGDTNAQLKLATLYFSGGIGVQSDKKKAMRWFTKAAKNDSIVGQIRLGTIYFNGIPGIKQNPKKSIYWYARAAALKSPIACFNLALCYDTGIPVSGKTAGEPPTTYYVTGARDPEKAADLYVRAAKLGLVEAQINAAILLKELERYAEAAKFFALAAQRGSKQSLREIGIMTVDGAGVKQDTAKGLKLLAEAAKKGDAKAQLKLADCYSGSRSDIAGDPDKMMSYLWDASTQGLPEAMSKLGFCLEMGIGVPRNHGQAVKWYARAAAAGYAQSMINLGHCYANGNGVEKDLEEAFKWYREAARKKMPMGNYNVGVCFAIGQGVEKDDTTAFKFFEIAAEAGLHQAQFNLGVFLETGRGTRINPFEAFKWYKKAADQNNLKALEAVAACYQNGIGTPKDEDKAKEYIAKAVALIQL